MYNAMFFTLDCFEIGELNFGMKVCRRTMKYGIPRVSANFGAVTYILNSFVDGPYGITIQRPDILNVFVCSRCLASTLTFYQKVFLWYSHPTSF